VPLKRHAVQIPTGFCRQAYFAKEQQPDHFLGILLEISKKQANRRLGISRAKSAYMFAISVTQLQN